MSEVKANQRAKYGYSTIHNMHFSAPDNAEQKNYYEVLI